MSEKQKLIKKLLKMQKKFIAYENQNGIDPKDYFIPEQNHPLHGYREEFAKLANKVIDLAHKEKGSKRFL